MRRHYTAASTRYIHAPLTDGFQVEGLPHPILFLAFADAATSQALQHRGAANGIILDKQNNVECAMSEPKIKQRTLAKLVRPETKSELLISI